MEKSGGIQCVEVWPGNGNFLTSRIAIAAGQRAQLCYAGDRSHFIKLVLNGDSKKELHIANAVGVDANNFLFSNLQTTSVGDLIFVPAQLEFSGDMNIWAFNKMVTSVTVDVMRYTRLKPVSSDAGFL